MSMQEHFIFCHGLGFDQAFWNNIKDHFIKERSNFLDLGFFGKENDKITSCNSYDNVVFTGIGHSLGLGKLIELGEQKNLKFKKLIGLQSCINSPVAKHHQKLYANDHIESLKHFYQYCNPDNIKQINLQHYIDKLDCAKKEPIVKAFRYIDGTIQVPQDVPVLIIGCQNDHICPKSNIIENYKASKNVTIKMMPGSHHCLGMYDTKNVLEEIVNF